MTATKVALSPTRNGTYRVDVEKIVKRDGRIEKFDQKKIVEVVKRCFLDSTDKDQEEATAIGWRVARAVVKVLERSQEKPSVEHVQRLVIQQLWVDDHFDAAEHYMLYREQQRQRRYQFTVSQSDQAAIDQDAGRFSVPMQYFQFISKYAKWNEDQGRRETWEECVDRVMGFFMTRAQLMHKLRDDEWADMKSALFNLEATPAMRVVQMAGPALERCNVGAYNCAYLNIDTLQAFPELLYILMQGSGVGFSVESEYIDKLPRVRKQQKNKTIHKLVIEDSTEGWCEALRFGMEKWFAGEDVEFDFTLIRPQGARLKTKGGRASGPEPLRQLLMFVRTKILARQGDRLKDKDCHDICCMIGKIVQVGGVRRASEISLSDLDSLEMRHAKQGNWWETSPWLDMANNSAVYDEKPDAVSFMEEWIALAKSGSGERGIFNRGGILKQIPKRRKKMRFGMNPCGEIILRSCQFCNLSIVVARPNDSRESLKRKVRVAAMFGTIQATLTDYKYLREDWKKNCEEERLLGVDITGQMDCELLRSSSNPAAAAAREKLLQELREDVAQVNRDLAERLGINPSTASTTVKPSGNSAQFFYCGSGGTPWYSQYFIRRARGSVFDPVSRLLVDEGVPNHPDPTNPSLLVFDFPMTAPPGVPTRNDVTAIDMLKNWLVWKKNWSEHSVSITVYVEPHEWLAVGNWVYEHWDEVSGLAFLPKSNANYPLAPYEEIDQATYQKLSAAFPKINWAKLRRYETEDMTTSAQELACVGGVCEL